ncbi:MAG TPA: hypothetical protein VF017_02090 [Thermoanaerobaculia bacterium]|nr:hypothetical protein [Thermoanaerobaculia bacterium]
MFAAKLSNHRQPLLLVDRLRPQVSEVFTRHQVPEHDAERIVQELVIALLYKWDGITNHEHWLLKTLEQKCLRLYGG